MPSQFLSNQFSRQRGFRVPSELYFASNSHTHFLFFFLSIKPKFEPKLREISMIPQRPHLVHRKNINAEFAIEIRHSRLLRQLFSGFFFYKINYIRERDFPRGGNTLTKIVPPASRSVLGQCYRFFHAFHKGLFRKITRDDVVTGRE